VLNRDLLKLRLLKTQKKIGTYYKCDIVEKVPEIDAVLIKSENDSIDLLILYNSTASEICTAIFYDFGPNKINAIRNVREITRWGLKESKDWLESFPVAITSSRDMPKPILRELVNGINMAGGSAELKLGSNCDKCELRFRCFTERW